MCFDLFSWSSSYLCFRFFFFPALKQEKKTQTAANSLLLQSYRHSVNNFPGSIESVTIFVFPKKWHKAAEKELPTKPKKRGANRRYAGSSDSDDWWSRFKTQAWDLIPSLQKASKARKCSLPCVLNVAFLFQNVDDSARNGDTKKYEQAIQK